MDPLGTTNACNKVVVPKRSRMIVTAHSAMMLRCTGPEISRRRRIAFVFTLAIIPDLP